MTLVISSSKWNQDSARFILVSKLRKILNKINPKNLVKNQVKSAKAVVVVCKAAGTAEMGWSLLMADSSLVLVPFQE